MSRRFAPPWWAWALTVFGVVACSALGVWQLHRGQQKQALVAAVESAEERRPVRLKESTAAPPPAQMQWVYTQGRYYNEQQLLLDNQVYQGAQGYQVWTPLVLNSGKVVIVDRGWIAKSTNAAIGDALQVTSEPRNIIGFWRSFPEAGIDLDVEVCAQESWPRVVHYPQHRNLACLYGATLLDGVLELSPAQPDGFIRQTRYRGLSPQKHLGYAVQWFALGLTALILFLILNFKKKA